MREKDYPYRALPATRRTLEECRPLPDAACYFDLARSEENAGNWAAALLLYLSSFCCSFNSGTADSPVGIVAKIRLMQTRLHVTDSQLLGLVHSYGPLTDGECRRLLSYSICGDTAGIRELLTASVCVC